MAHRIGVIIPAAGGGKRLGGVVKPLIKLHGKPIITRVLEIFSRLKDVSLICLAVPAEAMSEFEEVAKTSLSGKAIQVVEGGTERALSVKNAYQKLETLLSEDDLVCIHDAARPLLAEEDLGRVIDAAWEHDAAFLAARVKDTLKLVDDSGNSVSTVDRSNLFAAQTPQVMKSGLLKQAYATFSDYSSITDEIMLMERIGVKAFVVEPKHLNLKLTTREDLELLMKLNLVDDVF
ncbi:MAG: 2-C-methyl-D-erythritol 4-phosphate cytidylyltransferase [Bacteroidetes bacterium]|nr:2-C-methyl-D-erythritol 4-phosphate cytidylyltransferase [Bacteroidota bacterium]